MPFDRNGVWYADVSPTPWPQRDDPQVYESQNVPQRDDRPVQETISPTWNVQSQTAYWEQAQGGGAQSWEADNGGPAADRSYAGQSWDVREQTTYWESGRQDSNLQRFGLDRPQVEYFDSANLPQDPVVQPGSTQWKGKGVDYGTDAVGPASSYYQQPDYRQTSPQAAVYEGAGQYVDPPVVRRRLRPAPTSADLEAGLRSVMKGKAVEIVEVEQGQAGPAGSQSGGELALSSRSSSETSDGFSVAMTRSGPMISRIIDGARRSVAEPEDRIRIANAIGNAMEAYGRLNSLPYVTAGGNALMNGYEGFEKFLETATEQYKKYERDKSVDWKALGSMFADMAMFAANSGAGFQIASSVDKTASNSATVALHRGKLQATGWYSAASAGSGFGSFLVRASRSAEKVAPLEGSEQARNQRESGDRAERGEERIALPDRSSAVLRSTKVKPDRERDDRGREDEDRSRHHRSRHKKPAVKLH